MLARVFTTSIIGVDASLVEAEVDLSRGLPYFSTVGLPDNAVKESRERIRSAIRNSGYEFPDGKITVNLAPADLKKEGSSFDLPVAIGLLKTMGVIKNEDLAGFLILGELSLDGGVRAVRGALSSAVLAKKLDKKIILPSENREEAAVCGGVSVHGVKNLGELVEFLNGDKDIPETSVDIESYFALAGGEASDISDVKGQEHVKRALTVAAAGGHNVLMIGPPGSGKTMLARRLTTILPDMTLDEAIETTRVHSVAGTLVNGNALVTTRPFRSPHHTISDAGLTGGGHIPRPGEVSLAHNGVLFLDELPEFKKNVLEALRQPVEDGTVTIARAAVTLTYPASFMLVCAMNPCPCGHLGDALKECLCTPPMIQRYRSRISGPLIDRIDIHVDVPRVRFGELRDERKGETSAEVRGRVNAARRAQATRFSGTGIYSNSRMSSKHLKKFCRVCEDSARLLESVVEKLGFSARAYTRILKVARTIADLEGSDKILPSHIAEAVQYRTLDRAVI